MAWASLAEEGKVIEQGILNSGGASIREQWVPIGYEDRTLASGRSRADPKEETFLSKHCEITVLVVMLLLQCFRRMAPQSPPEGEDRYPTWWVVPSPAPQAPEWREGLGAGAETLRDCAPWWPDSVIAVVGSKSRRLTHLLTSGLVLAGQISF